MFVPDLKVLLPQYRVHLFQSTMKFFKFTNRSKFCKKIFSFDFYSEEKTGSFLINLYTGRDIKRGVDIDRMRKRKRTTTERQKTVIALNRK